MNTTLHSEIEEALRKNRLEKAESLLDELIHETTNTRQIRYLSARLLEKQNYLQKAKDQFLDLCEENPDWLAPSQSLFHICLKTKDATAAAKAIKMARARGASESWLLDSHTRNAVSFGNLAEYLVFLDKMIRREPNNGEILESLRLLVKRSKKIQKKYEFFDQLNTFIKKKITTYPESNTLYHCQQMLWEWSYDDNATLQLLSAKYEKNQEDPLICAQYIGLLCRCSKLEIGKTIFIETVKRGAYSAKLFNLGHYFQYTTEEREYLTQSTLDYMQCNRDNASIVYAAGFLTSIGQWHKAEELLSHYNYNPQYQAIHLIFMAIRAFIKFLKKNNESIEISSPVFTDDQKDCSIHKVTGAKVTLILFPGLADAVMFPLALFHAILKPLKINVIFLRDRNRSLYLSGLASLSDDWEATVIFLKNQVNKLEGERLYCLGTSAGGFAACVYGKALQAEKCFSFSGATNLSIDFVGSIEMKGYSIIERINSEADNERLDLKKVFGTSVALTKIIHYYCEENTRDRKFAEYISDLPSAELRPLTGGTHASFLKLLGEENLVDLLKKEMAL